MFKSSEEYLKYLQNVLIQIDVTEYVNRDYVDIAINRTKQETPSDHDSNLHKAFELYKKAFDKQDASFGDHYPEELALDVILKQINDSIDADFKALIENVAIGGLYKLFPDAKIFKNQENHCAVLISTSMVKVIYNNISFLEATASPENVDFFSFANESSSELSSNDYNIIHKNYLAFLRETKYPESVILTFDSFSTEMVVRHFELIITFIVFHEYAHFINGDLDDNSNIKNTLFYTKKAIEFRADALAIDLMIKYYLPNFPYAISPLELVLMIEYYFFRLLYLLNFISNDYPNPKERTINLLQECAKKYNINEQKINTHVDYFKFIYSEEP